ncbi:WD40 repeat-like-containing domain [Pochonia chlamydosporia 170]|uniref:WD40 repeat-like-containing domain n=1 Tax=Pochonia chlamydosporia 170 TaxID=1380566 RepID=A0A179F8J0_METCM|nr:WD40 repeat-like-containing domain [Pochonia chlamydosporia 170]OAQ61419.1 WD40 repeat-like-containing domain [Pochonia chlamydosporia 170]
MRGMKGRKTDSIASTMESSYEPDDFVATSTYGPVTTTSHQSGSSIPSNRLYRTNTNDTVPRRPTSEGTESHLSTRRTSSNASSTYYPTYSLYPAPTKPLPPLPPKVTNSASRSIGRPPSERSVGSSGRSSHYSDRSGSIVAGASGSISYKSPTSTHYTVPSEFRHSDQQTRTSSLELSFKSMIVSDDKRINNSVHYLDVSSTSSTLATKHGNNIVKVWSLETGDVQSTIKFSSYTEAQSRSRDYLIRSHAILSETSRLIAIASRFGRSIEIWNWEKKKCLQTIDNADRWSAGKMEVYDHGWGRFAAYRGEAGVIDLFAATREKKPFVQMRSINLSEAGLPFVPQYPELALSPTSPLLVAAAGPRPPRRGHPPPDRETLLVAWETHDNGLVGSKPYRVARPWQHKEIDTAIPSDLTTYGSVVVSIWIPATFRAVPAPASRGGTGYNYNLTPVKVPSRYVLVWDLAANSTRTFAIPNCTACISPDCRYVAYCHASGAAIGARGTLAVIDVMSSEEVWCWPDRNATAVDSGPKPGFKQFEDLARVTELAFSADGKSLVVGDGDGRVGVYDIHGKNNEQGPGNLAMAY